MLFFFFFTEHKPNWHFCQNTYSTQLLGLIIGFNQELENDPRAFAAPALNTN